jgi:hypothetical protein
MKQNNRPLCDANLRLRPGETCSQPAGWGTDHVGTGRCRFHGGATPRGADSPHFVHGGYSGYIQDQIAEKVRVFENADPFDLTHELALTRALLADFISRIETPYAASALETISLLVDRIRKIVESINRIKNDSALTAAEITYLAARSAEVVTRYIDDPVRQKAFIQELFGGIAGANSAIQEDT